LGGRTRGGGGPPSGGGKQRGEFGWVTGCGAQGPLAGCPPVSNLPYGPFVAHGLLEWLFFVDPTPE